MNFYVLPASLRIAHDTFGGFMAGMLHYPESLRPAALLARLQRRQIAAAPRDLDDPV
jgi:hypothetical protein